MLELLAQRSGGRFYCGSSVYLSWIVHNLFLSNEAMVWKRIETSWTWECHVDGDWITPSFSCANESGLRTRPAERYWDSKCSNNLFHLLHSSLCKIIFCGIASSENSRFDLGLEIFSFCVTILIRMRARDRMLFVYSHMVLIKFGDVILKFSPKKCSNFANLSQILLS